MKTIKVSEGRHAGSKQHDLRTGFLLVVSDSTADAQAALIVAPRDAKAAIEMKCVARLVLGLLRRHCKRRFDVLVLDRELHVQGNRLRSTRCVAVELEEVKLIKSNLPLAWPRIGAPQIGN